MRKMIIYGILLVSALLIPNNATELGKMKPVEAICLRIEDNLIIIETDTEDAGEGRTVEEALQNLKNTTAGTIYLDTADYLLVMKGAEPQIPQLLQYLKEGVRLCSTEEAVDLKKAAEYLGVHKPAVKLIQWQEDKKLQVLKEENGRLILQ